MLFWQGNTSTKLVLLVWTICSICRTSSRPSMQLLQVLWNRRTVKSFRMAFDGLLCIEREALHDKHKHTGGAANQLYWYFPCLVKCHKLSPSPIVVELKVEYIVGLHLETHPHLLFAECRTQAKNGEGQMFALGWHYKWKEHDPKPSLIVAHHWMSALKIKELRLDFR